MQSITAAPRTDSTENRNDSSRVFGNPYRPALLGRLRDTVYGLTDGLILPRGRWDAALALSDVVFRGGMSSRTISYAAIAAEANCSRRTAIRMAADLEAAGVLRIQRRRCRNDAGGPWNETNRFRFNLRRPSGGSDSVSPTPSRSGMRTDTDSSCRSGSVRCGIRKSGKPKRRRGRQRERIRDRREWLRENGLCEYCAGEGRIPVTEHPGAYTKCLPCEGSGYSPEARGAR